MGFFFPTSACGTHASPTPANIFFCRADSKTSKGKKKSISGRKMSTQMEKQVSQIYCSVKQPIGAAFLFQVSRSCDTSLLICSWPEARDTIHTQSMEFGLPSSLAELPKEMVDLFGFTKLQKELNGDKTTTSTLFPGRLIFLQREAGKARAMIMMGARKVKILGVHVQMELMRYGPPSIHAILLVGYDMATKTCHTESLSVASFLLHNNTKLLALY
jgi:hypothetical protein